MSIETTVVLVHGAWHGAWCWSKVVDGLVSRGIPVAALDLPGRGDDDGPITDLYGDAIAVRRVLDDVATAGAVLVGHSWGGAVITEAGLHPAVRHLVYLAAFQLDHGESCFSALEASGLMPAVAERSWPRLEGDLTVVDPESGRL